MNYLCLNAYILVMMLLNAVQMKYCNCVEINSYARVAKNGAAVANTAKSSSK
jgi:hypothetical protein